MAAEAARVKKELLAFHPRGDGIDIVGTEEGSNGRTCENHTVACGKLLEEDMVLRLRKCQITDEHGYEMTAIAAVWVTEGNDSCRVGFLPRHCVKHMDLYNGRLVQVVNIYTELDDNLTHRRKFARNRGCCRALFIETIYDGGGYFDNRKLPPAMLKRKLSDSPDKNDK